MIKIISCLIATVSMTSLSFGQITLEHTYTTDGYIVDQQHAFLTDNGLYYYTLSEHKVLIYDSSHVLYKTIILDIGEDFNIHKLYLPTDKLFNANDKIEFIVVSFNSNTVRMTLVDEDGVNLFEFGNRVRAEYIKIADSDYKLLVSTDTNPPNTYDIYDLTGTLSLNQQLLFNKNNFIGFPNPTENRIAITNNLKSGQNATLEVFDLNGKTVMKKNLTGDGALINLDVTELSSGVYIYKLNGQTNKFIKK